MGKVHGSIFFLLVAAMGASSQTPVVPSPNQEVAELLELLDTPVTVASKGKAMTIRESPGVVSLVTRQEILDSGARDLIDVLRLVPGLDFACDVQGVVSIGMRGIWAPRARSSSCGTARR